MSLQNAISILQRKLDATDRIILARQLTDEPVGQFVAEAEAIGLALQCMREMNYAKNKEEVVS